MNTPIMLDECNGLIATVINVRTRTMALVVVAYHQQSMRPPKIRKLGILAWLLCFGCFLIHLSFYFLPHMPTTPDPSAGYIHGLNNHGYITYLNDTQWHWHVTFGLLALGFGIVFGLCVLAYGQSKKHENN